jgi:small subunit ribosomal protein S6
VRTYELTVILRTGAKTEESKTAVKNILSKHGITIKEDQSWGVKKLAYSINEEKDGYYLHLIVESDEKAINTISADFHVNREILRHMAVVRQDPKSA